MSKYSISWAWLTEASMPPSVVCATCLNEAFILQQNKLHKLTMMIIIHNIIPDATNGNVPVLNF